MRIFSEQTAFILRAVTEQFAEPAESILNVLALYEKADALTLTESGA